MRVIRPERSPTPPGCRLGEHYARRYRAAMRRFASPAAGCHTLRLKSCGISSGYRRFCTTFAVEPEMFGQADAELAKQRLLLCD